MVKVVVLLPMVAVDTRPPCQTMAFYLKKMRHKLVLVEIELFHYCSCLPLGLRGREPVAAWYGEPFDCLAEMALIGVDC